MKVFVILLVLIGLSLSYSNLPYTEARTVAPLSIVLEDATIKQNSFITADGGVPDITIQKGETVSFPLKVSSRGLEPLPVNFFHSIEYAIPETRRSTLPDMKIEFEPFNMVLKPDESQMLNVTITTMNYTQLGEHRITVTAQYPQGEPLLNTGLDVWVVNETQYENLNSNSKYPVPGGGIISDTYPVKKQFEMGLKFENLKCNEGHVLIQKYDGTPACVTEQTKTKLIERGWTAKYDDENVYGISAKVIRSSHSFPISCPLENCPSTHFQLVMKSEFPAIIEEYKICNDSSCIEKHDMKHNTDDLSVLHLFGVESWKIGDIVSVKIGASTPYDEKLTRHSPSITRFIDLGNSMIGGTE